MDYDQLFEIKYLTKGQMLGKKHFISASAAN